MKRFDLWKTRWVILTVGKKRHNASDCTLPAGANSELSFNLGGVERVILCDQEGLEGRSIHKQSHCRELDVQHIVMPFFITDLQANSRLFKYIKKNPHPFIHTFFVPLIPHTVTQDPITIGLRHKAGDAHPFTHYGQFQSRYSALLWTGKGNPSTRRTPPTPNTENIMQHNSTHTHTQGTGRNATLVMWGKHARH